MRLKHIILLAVALSLTLLFAGCTKDQNINDNDAEWGDAPDFTLKTLEGETIVLSEFKDSIIILNFAGVNCGLCVPQTLVLELLKSEYDPEKLEIITIYVWNDSVSSVLNLIQAYKCESPCEMEDNYSYLYIRELKAYVGMQNGLDLDWYFAIDIYGEIAEDYVPTGAVPKIVIIDQNGNIYYEFPGYTPYTNIADKLDEILN